MKTYFFYLPQTWIFKNFRRLFDPPNLDLKGVTNGWIIRVFIRALFRYILNPIIIFLRATNNIFKVVDLINIQKNIFGKHFFRGKIEMGLFLRKMFKGPTWFFLRMYYPRVCNRFFLNIFKSTIFFCFEKYPFMLILYEETSDSQTNVLNSLRKRGPYKGPFIEILNDFCAKVLFFSKLPHIAQPTAVNEEIKYFFRSWLQ